MAALASITPHSGVSKVQGLRTQICTECHRFGPTALPKQEFIFSECLNCTKFDQLIVRKIIKIVATRFHILRLKCTKLHFGWGSDPDPAGGAYSAPQTP